MNAGTQIQPLAARGIAMIGVALLLPGAILTAVTLSNHREWMPPLAIAGGVSFLSAAVSVLLLMLGMRRGGKAAVSAVAGAWMIRTLVSVGGGLLAIFALHLAPTPTLLMILCFYLSVLVAETVVLINSLTPVR